MACQWAASGIAASLDRVGRWVLDFEDLVTALAPPPNRVGKSVGDHEHHLYEGAVMIAYAMHLLRTEGAKHVRVHPDGMASNSIFRAGWRTVSFGRLRL
jgi:hypothetical protein